MASFIGYPNRKVLAVIDDRAALERAVAAITAQGIREPDIETFTGAADAERFDATGQRHFDTEELARRRGPEPCVSNFMKH